MYTNYPILWVGCLQTEIALSTTKAEYITLSQLLRDIIPLITFLKEINKVFPVHVKTPTFVCKVHENNQSCIMMATEQKFTPCTKHITHISPLLLPRQAWRNPNFILMYT